MGAQSVDALPREREFRETNKAFDEMAVAIRAIDRRLQNTAGRHLSLDPVGSVIWLLPR